MIYNLVSCSKQSLYQDVNIKAPSPVKEQQKLSQIYELPQYQITNHCNLDTSESISKGCILATINKQNKLQINEDALENMASYSKFQIIYCGVYGAKNSGKSTFIDSLLKLDKQKQKGFKAIGKSFNVQSLIISKEPISIGLNKKLFFIQYSKGCQIPQIPQTAQKLLDLFLFISNSVVVMINKGDILKLITQHIQISAKRLQLNGKSINFWPQNLYLVNTYNNISKNIEGLDKYFRRVSLILWIIGQSRSLFNFLQDISVTTDIKSFKTLSNNYHITKKLLLKLGKEQNKIKNSSGELCSEVIFQQVYQQLCFQYLIYHQQLYDSTLHQYFQDQKPYKIDYLIQSFQKCKEIIIAHFKQNHIIKDSNQAQLQKLESYIDQRQRLIVEVNKKKTQFQLKKQLEGFQTFRHKFPKADEIDKTLTGLRSMNQRFQHAGVDQYTNTLYDLIKNIEKGQRKLAKKEEQHNYDRINALQNSINLSNQQLKRLKTNNNDSNFRTKGSLENVQKLNGQITRLKRQLESQRRIYKEIFNGKLANQQKAEKLLDIVRELQQKVRQNSKIKLDIERQYGFNPQIERLQRNILNLQRKINGQESKLQGAFNSQIQNPMKTESKISSYKK